MIYITLALNSGRVLQNEGVKGRAFRLANMQTANPICDIMSFVPLHAPANSILKKVTTLFDHNKGTVTRKRTLLWTPVAGLAIWALFSLGAYPAHIQAEFSGTNPLRPISVIIASAMIGLGLAILGVLLVENYERFRPVLSPTWGKAIATIIMVGITPLSTYGPFPVALVFVVVNLWSDEPSIAVALLIFANAVWYLVSGLIISGIKKRQWRVLAYSAIWLAVYCNALLIFGL